MPTGGKALGSIRGAALLAAAILASPTPGRCDSAIPVTATALSGMAPAGSAAPAATGISSPLVYVVIAIDTEADNGHPMESLHPTLDLHNYKRCASSPTMCSGDGSTWITLSDGTAFNFKVAPSGGGGTVTGYSCGFGDAYGLDRFTLAGRFTVASSGSYDVALQLAVTGSPPSTRISVVPDLAGVPDVAHPLSVYEARAGGFASGSYVEVGSHLSLQAGQTYWWVAARQTAGDAGNRFTVYQGAESGSGATSFARIMDPAFRGVVTDSDGRPFRMTWYLEMDNFINNGRQVDGRRMSYLTLYDELTRSWGAEIEGHGDELAYHHHFMYWDGSRWRQGGQEHAVDGQYDEHNKALDRMVIEAGFFPGSIRAGWLANDNQLQTWVERWLLSDAGGHGWATAWRPYHPSAEDYTVPGSLNHWILNDPSGPTQSGVDAAFAQALAEGRPVVYAWGMHQRDDMRGYVAVAHGMLQGAARAYPGVPFRYVTAREAIQAIAGTTDTAPPALTVVAGGGDSYVITSSEPLWGDGPYVAGRYGAGSRAVYVHVPALPGGSPDTWTARLPAKSGPLSLEVVGAGALDVAGNSAAATFRVGSPNVVAAVVPAGGCVSTAHPCTGIPVDVVRADVTPVRAYRVALRLSPGLAACGPRVAGGTYLDPSGASSLSVVDLGDGAYEVDEAIQEAGATGVGTGTGNGTLFTIYLTGAPGSGGGTIAIDSVQLLDGAGSVVPAAPGPAAAVPVDWTGPAALEDFLVQQSAAGDHDGTLATTVTFKPPADGGRVQVYRKAHGGYPTFAGAAPALPARPGLADSTGWTRTAVTASGQQDDPPARDCWYYVAYTIDECGNATAAGPSGGTVNYLLGDASNGSAKCSGDNSVNMADVSLLGGRYGARSGEPSYLECLDVGPSLGGALDGRPIPDGVLGFDDLVLLALNSASPGEAGPRAMATQAHVGTTAAAGSIGLEVPELPGVGATFPVAVAASGDGGVQAMSLVLEYDRSLVEMEKVEGGELLARQAVPALALSPEPGRVDVALLGRAGGVRGAGVLATVTFRVLAAGDPKLRIASLDCRDASNQKVAWGGVPVAQGSPVPTTTGLRAAQPNPFSQAVTIALSLAKAGAADVVVYSAGGRRVRTLGRGARPAGEYSFVWDGRDDGGRTMPAGVYYVLLVTADGSFTRKVTYLK